MPPDQYRDRAEAGRLLALELAPLKDSEPVILAVPRGGVPVAAEVAALLGAPLDVVVVRKLGLPAAHEVAMGAIGERGTRVIDQQLVRRANVSAEQLGAVESREGDQLEARAARFRRGREPIELTDKTVIVIDDGVATGATAMAACREARTRGATTVILAVPVGAQDTIDAFADADRVVCLKKPVRFFAVGEYYRDFSQTKDDEVVRLLDELS
jgi:putative phosphoribosyl transferase